MAQMQCVLGNLHTCMSLAIVRRVARGKCPTGYLGAPSMQNSHRDNTHPTLTMRLLAFGAEIVVSEAVGQVDVGVAPPEVPLAPNDQGNGASARWYAERRQLNRCLRAFVLNEMTFSGADDMHKQLGPDGMPKDGMVGGQGHDPAVHQSQYYSSGPSNPMMMMPAYMTHPLVSESCSYECVHAACRFVCLYVSMYASAHISTAKGTVSLHVAYHEQCLVFWTLFAPTCVHLLSPMLSATECFSARYHAAASIKSIRSANWRRAIIAKQYAQGQRGGPVAS